MKTQYLMLSLAFTLLSVFSFAGIKTDTIKVYGNCSSCKMHIENAAKAAGASDANWNKETKVLVVTYDETKTSNTKIQQKIASVGYDTQDVKATDASYNKLDKCCQYDRPKPGQSSMNKSATPGKPCCDDKTKCDKTSCIQTGMDCCKPMAKRDCNKNPTSHNTCCS